MSRWKSPQVAAKLAERAAKEAEKRRKEKRKSRLMLIGVILLMIAAVVADMFFIAYTRHQPTIGINTAAARTLFRLRRSHETRFRLGSKQCSGAMKYALSQRTARCYE